MVCFRLSRRFKICSRISLNISKYGPSISIGPRGLKAAFMPQGIRKTAGIPETSVYYSEQEKYKGEDKPQLAQSSGGLLKGYLCVMLAASFLLSPLIKSNKGVMRCGSGPS